jgi:hypothetical protein
MNDNIDEQHELIMRAMDEQRQLTDTKIAIQGDLYYEFQQNKYESD